MKNRLPTNVSLRKATQNDAEGIARVHIPSWKETYRGIVPDSYLDAMNLEERILRWQNGTLSSPEKNNESPTFVALDGTKIVGFATCGPNRKPELPYDGELWAIYLLKQYQGTGLGHALFTLCTENFKLRGFKSMYAWVLHENPTLQWYLKNGGTIGAHTEQIPLGDKQFDEVSVEWKSLL